MGNITLIEENKKLQNALQEISNPDWKECHNYIMAFEKAQRLADKVLNSLGKSFFVLKQINGKGPIYKLEVQSETLEILEKQIIKEIPEGWSVKDFYELLDEGNRLDIEIG